MLAVISGTGFYTLGKEKEDLRVSTKHGVANASLVTFANEEIVFLPRHGKSHLIPSHKINYRANAAAMRQLDVTGILAIYDCGIVSSKYKIEDLALVDDFMNLTGAPATFYDDFSLGIHQKDFTHPFDERIVDTIAAVSRSKKIGIKDGAVIGTTIGPRRETRSEVKALEKLGANLVSNSAGFEMALLGEGEIDFAAVAVASYYCAGLEPNPKKKKIKHDDSLTVMKNATPKLENLIAGLASELH
ncbi:MTAP family purine nucleoside phosphorylase [Candidatus Micrarchaeota archaeon]|nr:MTAP family purine nucleoside phosphorylase [Candidatus Micrarchaeota archaeon]